jgi:hypothetical protein
LGFVALVSAVCFELYRDREEVVIVPQITTGLEERFPFSDLDVGGAVDVVQYRKRVPMGPGYEIWSRFRLQNPEDIRGFQNSLVNYATRSTSETLRVEAGREVSGVARLPRGMRRYWVFDGVTSGTRIVLTAPGDYMEWLVDETSGWVWGVCTD